MTNLSISINDIDEAYLIKYYQPKFSKLLIEFKIKNDLLYRVQEDLLHLELEEFAEYTMVKSRQVEGTWLTSYLRSFGSTIEVVKPTELKEKIKDEIIKNNQIYF